MTDVFAELHRRVGVYSGHGIQGDDTPFHAELSLTPLLGAAGGVSVKFSAVGIDGTVLHEERTWIAVDDEGSLCLWSITEDGFRVSRYEREPLSVVPPQTDVRMGFCRFSSDARTVTSKVTLDLHRDGRLSYVRERRGPGGLFHMLLQVSMALRSAIP